MPSRFFKNWIKPEPKFDVDEIKESTKRVKIEMDSLDRMKLKEDSYYRSKEKSMSELFREIYYNDLMGPNSVQIPSGAITLNYSGMPITSVETYGTLRAQQAQNEAALQQLQNQQVYYQGAQNIQSQQLIINYINPGEIVVPRTMESNTAYLTTPEYYTRVENSDD